MCGYSLVTSHVDEAQQHIVDNMGCKSHQTTFTIVGCYNFKSLHIIACIDMLFNFTLRSAVLQNF